MYYPRKIEYWVCSDMRQFSTEKEAQEHEEYLERERMNSQATVYNAEKNGFGMDDVIF